jgi:hypothetical protein
MSSPQLQLAMWVSQPLIQAAIAVVVFHRRLHRDFPAFFTFVVVQVAIFAVEFPVNRINDAYYFDVYWASVALNVVLEFKIIHEIFQDVFRPYPALKDLATALFKWAALIMILVSVVLISVSPGWDDPVTRSILVVQRCVRVVQCGLVIFLLAFCKNLRVAWRRLSFGIALGFGLFSGAELLTTAFYSGSHVHGRAANLLMLLSYDLGMLVWLNYTLLNRRDALVPVLIPQRWDEALTDIQPQNSGESLIPMFEHMVDQALSKAQHSQV